MSTRHSDPGPTPNQPIPVGIEALIGMAAANPEFAAELLADRRAALAASGVALTPTEGGIFAAIDDGSLAAMIENVRAGLSDPGRRAFLARSAAALLVLAGGGVAQASCSDNNSHEQPVTGSRPDRPKPPVTGNRPDRPEPPIAPADASANPQPAATPADAAPADAEGFGFGQGPLTGGGGSGHGPTVIQGGGASIGGITVDRPPRKPRESSGDK